MFNILDLLRDVGATIGTDNNQCEVVIIDLNKWRCFVNSVKTLNQDVAKLSEERDALQDKLGKTEVELHDCWAKINQLSIDVQYFQQQSSMGYS